MHQPYRDTTLEHLRISDTRVGHVDMNAIRAALPVHRATPTRNRLINTIVVIPKEDVVHRSLPTGRDREIVHPDGCGRIGEREEAYIGEPLRQFHVAGGDCLGALRVGNTIIGDGELQRARDAIIHRHIVITEDAQHEDRAAVAAVGEALREPLVDRELEVDARGREARAQVPLERLGAARDAHELARWRRVAQAANIQPE